MSDLPTIVNYSDSVALRRVSIQGQLESRRVLMRTINFVIIPPPSNHLLAKSELVSECSFFKFDKLGFQTSKTPS